MSVDGAYLGRVVEQLNSAVIEVSDGEGVAFDLTWLLDQVVSVLHLLEHVVFAPRLLLLLCHCIVNLISSRLNKMIIFDETN